LEVDAWEGVNKDARLPDVVRNFAENIDAQSTLLSWVNKPFDRIVKGLAEEAPRLFLQLLGIVPPDADITLTPLRPETAPPVIFPDYVAALTTASGEMCLVHVEFYTHYHFAAPGNMARYGGSLAGQHQCRVDSVLLLLRPEGVPHDIPTAGEYTVGVTTTIHPFRTVRIWELDPAAVMESNDPRLFPWAVLMKCDDEQVRMLAGAVARYGDEETFGRFLTLGSIRYDRNRLEEMLGGPKMGLVEAILEGSSLVREAKEKAESEGRAAGLAAGLAEGRAEGREAGQVEGARRLLRSALQRKFPGLDAMPEIDAIASVETLESILTSEVLSSSERIRVEQAIRAAAPAWTD
jgi:hypothetical protein